MNNKDKARVIFGDSIRAVDIDQNTGKLDGYLMVFGQRDSYDTVFDANTYYGQHRGDGMDVLFNHAIPVRARSHTGNTVVFDDVAKMILGSMRVVEDEYGLFASVVLDLNNKYKKAIYDLGKRGALGWSSGTSPHLMDFDDSGYAKRWIIAEGSLTPMPAQPLSSVRSVDDLQDMQITIPDFEELNQDHNVNIRIEIKDQTMTEEIKETKPPEDQNDDGGNDFTVRMDGMSAQLQNLESQLGEIGNLNEAMTRMMAYMEQTSKKDHMRLHSDTGGTSDQNIRSFGDFLMTVARKDYVRYNAMYHTRDLAEASGVTGGFLVPDEYQTTLQTVSNRLALVRPRATIIPVSVEHGSMPALDIFQTPTAGSGATAEAAGVTTTQTAEGAELTETEPVFKQIEWTIKKQGGYTISSMELIEDSPVSIEAVLTQLFGIAMAQKEDQLFLHGTGSNEPLGIFNSNALITHEAAAADIFAYVDASNMSSKFYSVGAAPIWICHPELLPDIHQFENGTGGSVLVTDIQGQSPTGIQIFSYPVLLSQHLARANSNQTVLLADLSTYMIFDRRGMTIAASEHDEFKKEQMVWRFSKRLDGQPWVTGTFKLSNPGTAFEQSPFVTLSFP